MDEQLKEKLDAKKRMWKTIAIVGLFFIAIEVFIRVFVDKED